MFVQVLDVTQGNPFQKVYDWRETQDMDSDIWMQPNGDLFLTSESNQYYLMYKCGLEVGATYLGTVEAILKDIESNPNKYNVIKDL